MDEAANEEAEAQLTLSRLGGMDGKYPHRH